MSEEVPFCNRYFNGGNEEIICYENKNGTFSYRWRIPLIENVRNGQAVLEEFYPVQRVVALVNFENNVPRFKTYYGSFTAIRDTESLQILSMQ